MSKETLRKGLESLKRKSILAAPFLVPGALILGLGLTLVAFPEIFLIVFAGFLIFAGTLLLLVGIKVASFLKKVQALKHSIQAQIIVGRKDNGSRFYSGGDLFEDVVLDPGDIEEIIENAGAGEFLSGEEVVQSPKNGKKIVYH